MLKVGDLARREDHRVRGVKIGKTGRDRGISHVCLSQNNRLVKKVMLFLYYMYILFYYLKIFTIYI